MIREGKLPELVVGPYRIIPVMSNDKSNMTPIRYVILSPSGDRLRYEHTLSQARLWALRQCEIEEELINEPCDRVKRTHIDLP